MSPLYQFSSSRDFHVTRFRTAPRANEGGYRAAHQSDGNRTERIVDSIRPCGKNILQYEFGADQCKKQGKRESQVMEPIHDAYQGEIQRTQTQYSHDVAG